MRALLLFLFVCFFAHLTGPDAAVWSGYFHWNMLRGA
jgi:hypothetical protein